MTRTTRGTRGTRGTRATHHSSRSSEPCQRCGLGPAATNQAMQHKRLNDTKRRGGGQQNSRSKAQHKCNLVDGDWLAKVVTRANKERHLELKVDEAGGAKLGRLICTNQTRAWCVCVCVCVCPLLSLTLSLTLTHTLTLSHSLSLSHTLFPPPLLSSPLLSSPFPDRLLLLRSLTRVGLGLAAWAVQGSAGHNHRRGATVVSNRDVQPGWNFGMLKSKEGDRGGGRE